MKIQKENIISTSSNLYNEFELLSKNQAIKLLRLSYESVNKLIQGGYINIIKIKTRERITIASLREFIKLINDNSDNIKQVEVQEINPELILEELINKYK